MNVEQTKKAVIEAVTKMNPSHVDGLNELGFDPDTVVSLIRRVSGDFATDLVMQAFLRGQLSNMEVSEAVTAAAVFGFQMGAWAKEVSDDPSFGLKPGQ